ncbi:helix-turn-helix transcriptional regulator [Micromonospora sp. FIMYZ51]|uniref:helix-turn-helix domain-containing protein n=1 Tax=Micromonospora sp. FIMYZ51 TaxID=3051832 RepID=UPI00311E2016
MPDTLSADSGVTTDTHTPRYRLTRAAAERARRKLGLRRLDSLATHLGISRSSFFRLLAGTYPISLNQAAAFADEIGWPITRVFERCDP